MALIYLQVLKNVSHLVVQDASHEGPLHEIYYTLFPIFDKQLNPTAAKTSKCTLYQKILHEFYPTIKFFLLPA